MENRKSRKVINELGQRKCSKCDIFKDFSSFTKDKRAKNGLHGICSDCKNSPEYKSKSKENNSNYYKSNKEKEYSRTTNYRLKKTYNIDLEEYNKLLEKQNYSCAICDEKQINLTKKLCVDHNHRTGKVRGLLCNSCNTSLGLLKEKENIIFKLIEYLQKDYANLKLNEGKFKIKTQLILREDENLIETIETEY